MKLRISGLLVIVSMLVLVPQVVTGQDSGISCTFTATANVLNLRSGPGITFESVGQLNTGDTLAVIGRDVGDDGYVWWQGAGNQWVRSDMGTSDCSSLCGDGVCEYGEDATSCSSDCSGTTSNVANVAGCLVSSCESCYETVDCYPDCNVCTCSQNEFGCPTCYCEYPEGATPSTAASTGSVTTSASVNCTFTASRTANLRSEPSALSSLLGELDAGDTLAITARDVGTDGYVWWQSTDGEWVRSDLGDSDCPNLCGDGVCEYDETLDSCSADCAGTSSATTTWTTTSTECVVDSCESCYETVDCYPDCGECTCSQNEYGCPECFCGY
ncbi:MAG: SH3 domain-containing protein [Anaerolineae bacterium]|nr:SH3 domain-containing protein [Anaerolineae bacterium]